MPSGLAIAHLPSGPKRLAPNMTAIGKKRSAVSGARAKPTCVRRSVLRVSETAAWRKRARSQVASG
ncbi:hypothetical protein D3C87_1995370 [compost metagenome]